MDYTKENIEKAVCEYFKVEAKDLYSLTKREYPWGIARDILIYLLFAAGYKTYMIDDWFGFARTMVYRRCAKISVALKSDTKIKEDITAINKLLNNE
jgi:chromosomal replication initiation ATPase DnaA